MDPEERLEEAALWKAMHDEYGDGIVALREDDKGDPAVPTFGRAMRIPTRCGHNPVGDRLEYWNDPAFIAETRRRFSVVPFSLVADEVKKLHADGLGAFVKSTRSKHAIFRIPTGENPTEVIGVMAYSFIDGGPALMVQELCEMRMEHRFFCIGREIVTDSPVQWALTPLDHPLPEGTAYETPAAKRAIQAGPDVREALAEVAKRIARNMEFPHAAIDCALINGRPGAIELNPMRLGQLGLYAADVRALASASRKLLPEPAHTEDQTFPNEDSLEPFGM